MIRRIVSVAALAGFAFAACAHAQEINFGVIATDSSSALKAKWEPLIADMKKRTGLEIKAFYAPDYNGVIEAMRFNKVQVAWFGNKSAMEAVDRSNGEVFVRQVYAGGVMGYKSLLITNKDSPIKSLDDVLKKPHQWTFGNGDPNSTSGYLVPSYYLWGLNNIDITKHFKAVRVASHGANILAVLNHQVDVATNNTEQLDDLKVKHPDKFEQLRVLWTSPLIPSDPFVWRKDLSPDVKAKIKGFLLEYGKTDDDKKVLKNLNGLEGFVASTDAQLLPIRQLELFKQRKKFETADISDSDRKTKLAEIDAKLAALASQQAK